MKALPTPAQIKRQSIRTILLRVARILNALQSGRQVNASILARELEVSSKTIHRDIDFLQDFFQLNITWDAMGNTYRVPTGKPILGNLPEATIMKQLMDATL